MKKILILVVLFVSIFEGAPAQSITQSQIIQAFASPTGQYRNDVRLRTPRRRRYRRVRRNPLIQNRSNIRLRTPRRRRNRPYVRRY